MIFAKRTLLLIALCTTGILLIVAVLVFFFRSSPHPETLPPDVVSPIGTLPTTTDSVPRSPSETPDAPSSSTRPSSRLPQTADATQLTTRAVQAPARTKTGNGVHYYDESDGFFYTVDLSGNVKKRGETAFKDVSAITWDKAADQAVLEFPDGSNILYDFTSDRQVTFPSHWESFSFSPDGEQLAAKSIALDEANRWLVVTSVDGSRSKAIQALGENADKVTIAWSPNEQIVAFASTVQKEGAGLDQVLYTPIGQNQENFPGLQVEGLGFEPKWSPSGNHLLYSTYSDYSDNKPLLWLVSGKTGSFGAERKSVGLNTWIDKCTFHANDTAYCAVPEALSVGAGLRRTLARSAPDRIYRVDLNTGLTSLVVAPTTPTTFTHLEVSEDGSQLFYQNVLTGGLEALPLNTR